MGEIIELGLNRVEGDLEVKIEVQDGRIEDAWCIGTMYRGFEQILQGRDATDGAVLTPRICGICGTAHQYVAVTAIEHALQCEVAPNAIRARNLCLMAEETQSDSRHTFLMFTVDFCNARYADHPLRAEVEESFAMLSGKAYRGVLEHTKNILKVVAIIGGQWPHANFMVPGGVTSRLTVGNLVRLRTLIDSYQKWYEQDILGCSLERWSENRTFDDVLAWVEASESHRKSPMGLFIRFARSIGLETLGLGEGNLLSYGSGYDPERWRPPYGSPQTLRAPGFFNAETQQLEPFDHQHIEEHIKHSWFLGYTGGRHPIDGMTVPEYDPDGNRYTWAKAPRYKGKVCESGPLAELFTAGDPLATSLFTTQGSNAFSRQFVRLHRPTLTLMAMRKTLDELFAHATDPYIIPVDEVVEGTGVGLGSAARGALAHWVRFKKGKIDSYQIITPTGWNASPRGSDDKRGHWEQSLVGTVVKDMENPIELGHIVRSHDACLVCTVHVLETDKRMRFGL